MLACEPLARTVKCYRASDRQMSIVFRSGDMAHAEPALPGCTVAVNDLFAY